MRSFSARLWLPLVLWIGGIGLAWMPLGKDPALRRATPARTSSIESKEVKVPLVFRPGKPQRLKAKTVHAYTFDLRANEFLRLRFDQQKNVDISIEVYDPKMEQVLRIDSPRSTRVPEDVPLLAQVTGPHELRVKGAEGLYTPRIVGRRDASPKDRTLADAARAYSHADALRLSKSTSPEMGRDYEEAARLAGQAGEEVLQADAYFRLGFYRCDRKQWKGCQDALLRARDLYGKQGDLPGQAVIVGELGKALQGLGQVQQARETFKSAIDLSRRTGRVGTEANAWLELGIMQIDEGEGEPALRSFEQARQLYRNSTKPIDEVRAMNSLGRVYTFLGRAGDAFELHKKAWKQLVAVKSTDQGLRAQTLFHLGDAYRGMGKMPQATACYLGTIEILKGLGDFEEQAKAMNNLGNAYYQMEQYQDALDVYLQAARTFHEHQRPADEAIALFNVGWIQVGMDRVDQAMTAFENSLAIGQRLHRRPQEMAAYFGIAWAERHRNNLLEARRNGRKAVDLLEELRRDAERPGLKASLLSDRLNFYDFLIEILMEQHRLQPGERHDVEAFEASEGTRARSLLESLGTRSAPPLVSLKDVQGRLLDDDTILLEYFLGDDRSFLWAVTRDSFATVELPARSRIEPLARDVYRYLVTSHHKEDLPTAAGKARELAEILLGPVANRLGTKRLLIVAPPCLQVIPFAAFPDITEKRPEGPVTAWPVPLVKRHEIVNAPSASFIAAVREMRVSRREPQNLLANISDPVYFQKDRRVVEARRISGVTASSEDILAKRFSPLAYLAKEADAIHRIAGKPNVLELRGFAANHDRILDGTLSSYRYINFSVHGEPDRLSPERSAIILSAYDEQGQSRNPFVYAADLQKLKISADLVVVASCSSGLGEELRGEGVVGLTQAFLTAGASRVLVSVWDLDDESTSELLPRFYLNLLQKGKSPGAALREAQLWMWEQDRWKAPHYWAGFVLQGEWK